MFADDDCRLWNPVSMNHMVDAMRVNLLHAVCK